MTVDCDLAKNFLSVLWLVIGLIVGGSVGAVLGRRRRDKREYTYKGLGGE